MQLYGYFRSSAAYRVRIALALKGLRPQLVFVHLTRGGGEQKSPDYRKINPQALVPTLITDDGHVLGQSLAIIEYLDETHPKPPLLPADPLGRARVRALALAVACEIHPLNNTRVLTHLTGTLGLSEAQKLAWYRHWIAVGLEGLEGLVAGHAATGRFCHGDAP
ncbi:MAG: maleylacetoacetate isomerase, partial [Alphaproteobacteria bacterium]|nr:maleylacetoacetate isomerase [Alphaproteobacteria bacterium]